MDDNTLDVVLVDDEPLAREHVRRSVDWGPLGLEIVGEASDGREALSLIDRVSPAVALIDINIPYLDGLEVSERIRVDHPECKVVVLTGFDDFDNARKALRAGVVEYVLKPLASEELTAALVRARDRHLSESRQRAYRSQLEAISRSASESDRESALGTLIAQADGPPDPNGRAFIDVGEGSRVTLLMIDGLENRSADVREQNRWYDALREIVRTSSGSRRSATAIGPDGRAVFLADSLEESERIVALVREVLRERFNFTVSAGISSPVSGAAQLRDAYLEALGVIRERFFSGHEFTGVAPVEERRQGVIVENKADLILALRMGDLDAIEAYLDAAFETVRRDRLDVESVLLMGVEMAAAGAQFLTELERDPGQVMDESGQPWTNFARTRDSMDELRIWLSHVFRRILTEARDDQRFRTFRVVELAMSYLGQNFSNPDLSLRTIADACSVNPTYLSKVFKTQTGHSVIEYLRSLRLTSATRLMKERPDARVNEIAEQSGFADPLYFSKVFKTAFGVSPRRYMRL